MPARVIAAARRDPGRDTTRVLCAVPESQPLRGLCSAVDGTLGTQERTQRHIDTVCGGPGPRAVGGASEV